MEYQFGREHQQMTGQEEISSAYARGGLDWILGTILHRKSCQALEQVAKRSGWVTIPEVV